MKQKRQTTVDRDPNPNHAMKYKTKGPRVVQTEKVVARGTG